MCVLDTHCLIFFCCYKNILELIYFISELNSSASTQSVEDLKLDLIYEKDTELDAVEISFPNASEESNAIPQSYSNFSASASGKMNNRCLFGSDASEI